MSLDAEALYNLLPAVYRLRDAEQGGPLRALMAVIAGQVTVLQEDLAQRYDDQFIETCADWVVPYIGELLGVRAPSGAAPGFSARAEVANTVGHRRRKGTAAMLEQLARDVADREARVVELFRVLATTAHVNHPRAAGRTASVRDPAPLTRLHTPFDAFTHTASIRPGGHNIPNVGIFLWRLRPHRLTDSPAVPSPSPVDDRRFRFSPLGIDAPLFSLPQAEEEPTHLAEPLNVPEPIGRRALHDNLAAYYGPGKSLLLRLDGQEVGVDEVVACDLSEVQGATGTLGRKAPAGRYAIDPVLGRLSLPGDRPLPAKVSVTFHYGFGANLGGGEYPRGATLDRGLAPVVTVPAPQATIAAALGALPPTGGAVEIADSGRYQESLALQLAQDARIELRAADGHRPTLVPTGELVLGGAGGAEVALNGLLLVGGAVRVTAGVRRLALRHCTLVPGIALAPNGRPTQRDVPSLTVESAETEVEIDHCILGGVRAAAGGRVRIVASILDATSDGHTAYTGPVEEAPGDELVVDDSTVVTPGDDVVVGNPVDTPGAALVVEDSTVVGRVRTAFLESASNAIFLGPVVSERRQGGCVRFCFLPPESRVPRRHRCQPGPGVDPVRARPRFTSLRYGQPGYGQLAPNCAPAVLRGADDEGELGAFHALGQPGRVLGLRQRLDEHLPLNLEAHIGFVT